MIGKIPFLSLLLFIFFHSTVSATNGHPQDASVQVSNLDARRAIPSSSSNFRFSNAFSEHMRNSDRRNRALPLFSLPWLRNGFGTSGAAETEIGNFPPFPPAWRHDQRPIQAVPVIGSNLGARTAMSESNFAFSNALHDQLRNSDGRNLVFSPVSVSLPLLMARFGASGTTQTEIDAVLRVPRRLRRDQRSLQAATVDFLESLRDPLGHYNVTVASKMYAKHGLEIRRQYNTLTREVFGAQVEQLDFANGQRAAQRINSWVERKTNGKIRGLMSPDALNGNTKLVMVNAIHFKSPWEHKFWSKRTRKQVFHLSSTARTEVDMMSSSERYSYAQLPELHAQLVVIPYKGGRFSMHVFIPNDIEGLESFLQALKNTKLSEIQSKIRETDTCNSFNLRLPKFKIESTLNLVDPLKQMGARAMFSARDAHFSKISATAELYVSDVVQKAYIEVDEEGTEASAATVMGSVALCGGRATQMTADRPFYYQIVDEVKNLILFAGVVRDPSV